MVIQMALDTDLFNVFFERGALSGHGGSEACRHLINDWKKFSRFDSFQGLFQQTVEVFIGKFLEPQRNQTNDIQIVFVLEEREI